MQGIFQKENTDKALKYGIYRHLPTYEKIIRNLVSFYLKTVEESCERFAVIDQEVVWYGNINLLAKTKVDDSIMRVLSNEIAGELMEIIFGNNS